MKLYIKHMACESCKVVVKEALLELNIIPVRIELGVIETKESMTDDEKKKLNTKIKKAGLIILESRSSRLIEKIKKEMVNYVYHSDERPNLNFSELLSKELNHSYGYLANVFAEVEATTIERYIISMRVERIKELIMMEAAPLKRSPIN